MSLLTLDHRAAQNGPKIETTQIPTVYQLAVFTNAACSISSTPLVACRSPERISLLLSMVRWFKAEAILVL